MTEELRYPGVRLNVGVFKWRLCDRCRKLGYRQRWCEVGPGLMAPMHPRAIAWHDKIEHEMWCDYINVNVRNLKLEENTDEPTK